MDDLLQLCCEHSTCHVRRVVDSGHDVAVDRCRCPRVIGWASSGIESARCSNDSTMSSTGGYMYRVFFHMGVIVWGGICPGFFVYHSGIEMVLQVTSSN